MKNQIGDAQRWFRQAEHDMKVAQRNLKENFFSDVCFMAEQASQKGLKAYLFFTGERFVLSHSVTKLALDCAKKDKGFAAIVDYGKILDKYYIPTRYPDALAGPSAPFEVYTQREAEEALRYAVNILDLVRKKITKSNSNRTKL
jgi:HEPN domain-containing protein